MPLAKRESSLSPSGMDTQVFVAAVILFTILLYLLLAIITRAGRPRRVALGRTHGRY